MVSRRMKRCLWTWGRDSAFIKLIFGEVGKRAELLVVEFALRMMPFGGVDTVKVRCCCVDRKRHTFCNEKLACEHGHTFLCRNCE